MHTYNIKPQRIETIKATRQDTKWKPDVKTNIANSTKNAIMDRQNDDSDVKIYTDGSGMKGKIGTAAALYRGGEVKAKLHYKLGSQKHHTVYEGEAIGTVLGAKLVAEQWGIQSATFCINNQATIKATNETKPRSLHYRHTARKL
jgi:hypothetical protein